MDPFHCMTVLFSKVCVCLSVKLRVHLLRINQMANATLLKALLTLFFIAYTVFNTATMDQIYFFLDVLVI